MPRRAIIAPTNTKPPLGLSPAVRRAFCTQSQSQRPSILSLEMLQSVGTGRAPEGGGCRRGRGGRQASWYCDSQLRLRRADRHERPKAIPSAPRSHVHPPPALPLEAASQEDANVFRTYRAKIVQDGASKRPTGPVASVRFITLEGDAQGCNGTVEGRQGQYTRSLTVLDNPNPQPRLSDLGVLLELTPRPKRKQAGAPATGFGLWLLDMSSHNY